MVAEDDGPSSAAADPASTVRLWAPLQRPAFRAFWVSILAVNVGAWMHTVATQWLLVDRPGAESLVALVQTSTMLPMLVFSLPAGALADAVDRRRLLVVLACSQTVVGLVLTGFAAAGVAPSWLLLGLTFLLGTGLSMIVPTWQAVVPELVPKSYLPVSAALGSISYNAARVVGPALAGVLLVYSDAAAVFLLNAFAAIGFVIVSWRWQAPPRTHVLPRERLWVAIRHGGRHVVGDIVTRRLLSRVIIFSMPAAALWALLPLVAARQLQLLSTGYGVLLGALGAGAVAGGILLSWLRARLSVNGLVTTGALVYAMAVTVAALVSDARIVTVALLPAGAAWVAVLATLNAMMQVYLPKEVRGRGMAIYYLVNAGAQAAAAAFWGGLAQYAGVVAALVASAVLLIMGAATIRRLALLSSPPPQAEPPESKR